MEQTDPPAKVALTDELGAIAEVHSDRLRWLIDDDDPRRPIGHALLFHERYVRRLEALGEMLAAVLQGAKEEFVRVPYGASHEDVAAINDWHKMAAEALREWESGK